MREERHPTAANLKPAEKSKNAKNNHPYGMFFIIWLKINLKGDFPCSGIITAGGLLSYSCWCAVAVETMTALATEIATATDSEIAANLDSIFTQASKKLRV